MTDQIEERAAEKPMDQELWLGYADAIVPFRTISALLVYQSAWDRRIAQHWGSVPADVQAVVLLTDGRVLPARRALADLHARWQAWQAQTGTVPAARPAGNRSQSNMIDEEP